MNIEDAAALPDGPARTAALAAWFQGLYRELAPERIPILVGGAAVELLTGGAYTTGDLDFVGAVPRLVADQLTQAGFRKEGRHWIREEGQIFLELPGSGLAEGERSGSVRVGDFEVLVVSAEDLIADRLASWQFWKVAQDAVGALLILRRQRRMIDAERLTAAAESKSVRRALESLLQFDSQYPGADPTDRQIEQWARTIP